MGCRRCSQLVEAGQDCLATRLDETQSAHLGALYPQAEQDRIARTFCYRRPRPRRAVIAGRVIVLTAGTSDSARGAEAVVTLAPLALT